ncbi:hypothetical protein [Dokdonella sp.]
MNNTIGADSTVDLMRSMMSMLVSVEDAGDKAGQSSILAARMRSG